MFTVLFTVRYNLSTPSKHSNSLTLLLIISFLLVSFSIHGYLSMPYEQNPNHNPRKKDFWVCFNGPYQSIKLSNQIDFGSLFNRPIGLFLYNHVRKYIVLQTYHATMEIDENPESFCSVTVRHLVLVG